MDSFDFPHAQTLFGAIEVLQVCFRHHDWPWCFCMIVSQGKTFLFEFSTAKSNVVAYHKLREAFHLEFRRQCLKSRFQ